MTASVRRALRPLPIPSRSRASSFKSILVLLLLGLGRIVGLLLLLVDTLPPLP